jgi:hypothetical protein
MTKIRSQAGKERFASRWSKRKQQVKIEQELLDANTHDTANEMTEAGASGGELANPEPAKLEQRRAEKLTQLNTLKDEDMPDIASLNENSDYSQFMSINVSEALRKIALRKLFQGKTYNIRDGLDEYDGDYTSFEKLDPGTITADMKYQQELAAEKRKAQLEQEQAEQARAISDEDSTTQQESDNTAEETSLIEDHDEAASTEEPQDPDAQAKKQVETKQPERELPADQITTKQSGENQT